MKQKSITFFLTRKLIFGHNNSYSIKIVTWVCLAAIMIGSMALTLIFAIMQGFESTTTERLQNIHPQIIMRAPMGSFLDFAKISHKLINYPSILAYTPYAIGYGVLLNPKLSQEIEFANISLIKAIDPNTEKLVTNLTHKITNANTQDNLTHDLISNLEANKIIIGVNLAKNMCLNINDSVEIFIPTETNARAKTINFKKIKAIISNTLKTGISEFDDSLIMTSLAFAQKHFHNFGIQEIGIKLKPEISPAQQKQIIDSLAKNFGLSIVAWQELYTPIIATLKLEKYTAIAIAILIMLIASMTLIALLFMLITKHTSTITILQILGLKQNKIRNLFILISITITSIASLTGIILATIIGLILQNYHFIELPDIYYISTLPIKLSFNILSFVFLINILIGLLASQLPLKLITRLNLSKLLKINN